MTQINNIPFFNYPFVYTQHKDEIDTAMKKVLERGAFILQDELFDLAE